MVLFVFSPNSTRFLAVQITGIQVHPLYVFSFADPNFHLICYFGLVLMVPGPIFPVMAHIPQEEDNTQVAIIGNSNIAERRRYRRRRQ